MVGAPQTQSWRNAPQRPPSGRVKAQPQARRRDVATEALWSYPVARPRSYSPKKLYWFKKSPTPFQRLESARVAKRARRDKWMKPGPQLGARPFRSSSFHIYLRISAGSEMIAQNEPNGVHSLFALSLTFLKGKLIWIEIYQDIPLITNIYIT